MILDFASAARGAIELGEPSLSAQGIPGAPRGRLTLLEGGPPGARAKRLRRWAARAAHAGEAVLWVDPLGEGPGEEVPEFPWLKVEGVEALDALLRRLPQPPCDLLIIEPLEGLLGSGEAEKPLDASRPTAGREGQLCAQLAALCWRLKLAMVLGLEPSAWPRREAANYGWLRLELSPVRAALLRRECRRLPGGRGWRRLPCARG